MTVAATASFRMAAQRAAMATKRSSQTHQHLRLHLFAAASSSFSTAAVEAPTPRRRLRELPPPLKLTDAAAERIRELLDGKPDAIGIRLGVRTRTYFVVAGLLAAASSSRKKLLMVARYADYVAMYYIGGCNGLSYTMNYADKKEKLEEEVSEKGVRVFVEPKALFHVVGTTMDFQTTPVSSEFVFENPNAKGSCGCGESFNV